MDPTLSFLELSLKLDEPVQELISMASYMQTQGLAKVIGVTYDYTVYKVDPKCVASLHDSNLSRKYMLLIKSCIKEANMATDEENGNVRESKTIRKSLSLSKTGISLRPSRDLKQESDWEKSKFSYSNYIYLL
jgi:hypothetical protein